MGGRPAEEWYNVVGMNMFDQRPQGGYSRSYDLVFFLLGAAFLAAAVYLTVERTPDWTLAAIGIRRSCYFFGGLLLFYSLPRLLANRYK